jgi:hypothetical protein
VALAHCTKSHAHFFFFLSYQRKQGGVKVGLSEQKKRSVNASITMIEAANLAKSHTLTT